MEGKINQTESKINKTKKYHTILADPPWGVSSQRGKNSHRSAESHYELMSLERIKAMPVQDLAEENSHLYLWIPNALLQEGLDVIKEIAAFVGGGGGGRPGMAQAGGKNPAGITDCIAEAAKVLESQLS